MRFELMAVCGCALSVGVASAQDVGAPPERTGEGVAAYAEARLDAVREEVDRAPRRIVLLGTFHFKDAGLDEYKPTHSFDAMSDRRQEEIGEVVGLLDGFDADVVCVERKPGAQAALDERFAAFKDGSFELPANEIYQIGFRVAALEGHEGVRAVDAPARFYEDRTDVQAWAAEHGQAGKLMSPYARAAFGFMREGDRRVDEWQLRDTLLLKNSEPMLDISHGMYLSGGFEVGDGEAYPGVDGFVTAWHNRNLRIFQNIANATAPGDDVLVVIGAGHVPLLRQMAISSPDFEVVEVHEVLGEK